MSCYRVNIDKIARFDYNDRVCSSCAKLLSTWFYERYNSQSISNTVFNSYPNQFLYRCSNIYKQIDKFLICCGYYIHTESLQELIFLIDAWILEIQSEFYKFPLPSKFSDLITSKGLENMLTPEAIYLEYKIKPIIFDDTFHPEYAQNIIDFARSKRLQHIVAQGLAITSLENEKVV